MRRRANEPFLALARCASMDKKTTAKGDIAGHRIIATRVPGRLDRCLRRFSSARHRRPRHHLDSRRPRSDTRRFARRRAGRKPEIAFHRLGRRPRLELLSRRRGRRRACLRLDDGPFGRKKLFFITLGLYSLATAATAFSFDLVSFCLFRFLTGAGIGGEYSAINSTIQEFTPARLRGRTDIIINGTFWIGGAIGAAASIVLLVPGRFRPISAGAPPSSSARCWVF